MPSTTTTTPVTPEYLNEMEAHYSRPYSDPCKEADYGREAVRVLIAEVRRLNTALAEQTARAEKVDADYENIAFDFNNLVNDHENALKRAEKAEWDLAEIKDLLEITERQRVYYRENAEKWERIARKLAEALAWGAGREKRSIFDRLPWCDGVQKWLEWAAENEKERG